MRIVRRDLMQAPKTLKVFIPSTEIKDEPEVAERLSDELEDYMETLMGRQPPPTDSGVMTLQEVATAYYARGQEINMVILRLERNKECAKGGKLNKFRTGELRAFLELTKRAADLGSRRLTAEQLIYTMRHDHNGLEFAEEAED